MHIHAGLRQRHLIGEWMDDPALDAGLHRTALDGLARINRLSRSSDLVWGAILPFLKTTNGRALRVLDIATGGGDVPIQLLRRARSTGADLDIAGCDISATALEVARRRAADLPINWHSCNVLHDPLPEADIITCSLFLHHLTEEQTVDLLSRMAASSRLGIVVNDLRRHWAGYAAAWLACRLLTRSPVVRTDGPLSVRAAFTLNEARELAQRAGLSGATIRSVRPWRWLMVWRQEKPHGS